LNPEKFFNSLVDYEKTPGYNYQIKDFVKFLKKLNTPQKKLNNVIHIAGTKGKGSTAAITSSCLQACGYSVGAFTSPHLKKINERITVNGKQITDKTFEKYIQIIKPYINFNTRIGARTYFEVLTTIAFFYFTEKEVDFTILEVGLGGRIDSTNVTQPLFSIITRIGYDHTNLLGRRLSQITREKAGIIKHHGKLITIYQRPSVHKVIKRTAHERACPIIYAEHQHKIKVLKQTLKGTRVRVKGKLGRFDALIPVIGNHQIENLLITLSVMYELKKMGFKITRDALKKGIRQTELHGRFEVIGRKPLIIFDGAHNPDSFAALDNNLEHLDIRNFYLIFGTSRDKDFNYCLKYIFAKAREVFLVTADNPRALTSIEIYKRAKKYQKNLTIAPSVKNAIECINRKTNKRGTIIITGSFYLWPF
jgi:dihydrofolate synthase/folylpolyglutamate synthase